jgi:hypothetical protein
VCEGRTSFPPVRCLACIRQHLVSLSCASREARQGANEAREALALVLERRAAAERHTGEIRVTLRRTRQRVKALQGMCAATRDALFERRIATRSTSSPSTSGT